MSSCDLKHVAKAVLDAINAVFCTTTANAQHVQVTYHTQATVSC